MLAGAMSGGKELLRQMKIKTNAVTRFFICDGGLGMPCSPTHCRRLARRMMKDITYSDKEMQSQRERIQKVKDDPEKDEYDVRKQA